MPVLPIEGQGTTVSIAGTIIGGTRSIDGLGSGSPSERDRTTFADTQFKRIGIGLRDGGSVSVGLIVDSTDQGQKLAYKAWKLGTLSNIVITYSNGVAQSFQAYVTTWPQTIATDGDVTGTMTLRVYGALSGFPDPS